MSKLSQLASASLLLSAGLWGQTRATITGTVIDQSGSPVPNVHIMATATATGTKSETVSSVSGKYTLPFLAPGNYTVAASAPGFKQFEQRGVTLDAGAQPVIDIKMDLGAVTENITVTAEAPLITSSNASVGQVVTAREVENLPVNGRTPLMLSTLAMGAVSVFEPGPVRPFDQPAATQVSLGGGPVGANESRLDGAPKRRLRESARAQQVMTRFLHER